MHGTHGEDGGGGALFKGKTLLAQVDYEKVKLMFAFAGGRSVACSPLVHRQLPAGFMLQQSCVGKGRIVAEQHACIAVIG
jgi:hypothetical protein